MPSVRKREKAVWTLDSVNRLLLWLSPDKMRDKSDLFSDQRSKGGKISTGREAERQCVLPHERANKLSKVNRESDSWKKVNKIISNIDSFHKMINGTEKCKWHWSSWVFSSASSGRNSQNTKGTQNKTDRYWILAGRKSNFDIKIQCREQKIEKN